MPDTQAPDRAEALRRRNRRTGIGVGAFVCGMVGLAFASVPLYDMFCRVTGYNGTVQVGGPAAPGAGERLVTVRFNANVQPDLPWRFLPGQGPQRVRVGEETMAFYQAENRSTAPVTGVATYNVTPEVVGKYFHKVHCFCFDQQTLEAGQKVDMPLSFWVDPRIGDDPNTRDIRTITISYSFFRSLDDAQRNGALANAGPHVGAAPRGTP
ncbi:cytochrome c oxidase assembly protein [Paracraurococcus ruber]|uniref:Cytochrome c oxidase assembly protein CtaG n=1 Tax=Paracraurococcus ruber TaxID=77675 RepID=A0ABS1D109_9PROT|nr:cytochrome c oxidase assembly protein [Paracraurococcus ruber]MBK1660494.1 cytochrome c oxidase assembly protein [Paracraurococcus ruber]TDG26687.1 cytochrome c oxidase assembly protein [Paracraurococcus ruber]